MSVRTSASARRLFGILGAMATLVCVYFFAKALFGVLGSVSAQRLDWQAIAATVLLSGAYGLALFLLADGWRLLLVAAERADGAETPAARLIPVYAVSQFAKYVPGNVFHLAGRHALLARRGFGHRALVMSALQENLLLVLAAFGVGLALVILFPGTVLFAWADRLGLPPGLLTLWVRLALAAVFAAGVFLAAVGLGRRVLNADIGGPLLRDGAFFALQGLLFVLLLYTISGAVHPQVAGIVALSWIAGFLTPGAPGGVGIREMVLLAVLGHLVGREDIILAAALYRVVTFCGDLWFFGYGLSALKRRAR